MGNRQLFAQIGVFALLGLNVGAYYVFWPHKDGGATTEAKAPPAQKGTAQLFPAKKETSALPVSLPPKEVAAGVVGNAEPLSISNPPAQPAEKSSDDNAVRKLLEQINKDADPVPPIVPMAVAKDAEATPNPTPPLKVDPDVAVTSALTPKVAPSPWLLNMEVIGNQTQLIARLRQPVRVERFVEFKILCDRVEMKAPGTVLALGKVSVVGAGLKGECQRLTLPLHEIQLVFEEKAHIIHDANAGTTLRGERIVWEQSANVGETQPLVSPAEFRPFNSYPIVPPVLGNPK